MNVSVYNNRALTRAPWHGRWKRAHVPLFHYPRCCTAKIGGINFGIRLFATRIDHPCGPSLLPANHFLFRAMLRHLYNNHLKTTVFVKVSHLVTVTSSLLPKEDHGDLALYSRWLGVRDIDSEILFPSSCLQRSKFISNFIEDRKLLCMKNPKKFVVMV